MDTQLAHIRLGRVTNILPAGGFTITEKLPMAGTSDAPNEYCPAASVVVEATMFPAGEVTILTGTPASGASTAALYAVALSPSSSNTVPTRHTSAKSCISPMETVP